ncbi:lantibiotic dehydratase [Humibacillus xanthopallidus]|uniref:Thiopeptide-type bacteriocin biosynthesis protein n=1 Tax=Humibacillus xanthopallidus TaxID=412689 RepID=A0A543HUC0_9MICO|nr:lantibiotic dehydratase [Humibacillus xanthopallidus]TQM61953.1 thiopeptide-type bacteriocin biosynthesis protein [Humibacillus xanthopallidus]
MTADGVREPTTGWYAVADALVVRAPLLPVSCYSDACARAGADGGPISNPLVRNAIHIGSESLGRAIDVAVPGQQPKSVTAATLRYSIRMSTRPTPFGLFAAVGLAGWDVHTDLEIADIPRRLRSRPDMGWLTSWVLALEADPVTRAQARLVANTSAFERNGRIHLSDRGTGGRAGQPDVSVRATGAVVRALALARQPIDHSALCAALLSATDGATPDRVETLVEDLCRHDLLLTDLRPMLTGDPVHRALHQLSGLAATRGAAEGLASALERLEALDRMAPGDPGVPQTLGAARAQLRELHAPAQRGDDVIQVDAALPLAGRHVGHLVAVDAARAVDLLLRMHPAPHGPAHLAAYRADFLTRYGPHRRVPLLELIDPRFGIGLPEDRAMARPSPSSYFASAREALLRELSAGALRDGALEIALTEEHLQTLSTWTPDPARLAVSLELSVLLSAADPTAIDRGDYQLVVGPNLGGHAAGRGLARFADLLGQDARNALALMAAAEQRVDPTLTAELVYVPARHRSANVVVRPVVRDFEIPVGVTAGVPADRVIAPDRIAVCVRDGRLRLWWVDGACEIRVCAGHMLNVAGAPAVCRILSELGFDGVAMLHGFDWGAAAWQPFLPRVRVDRIVLQPAQWRWPRDRLRRLLAADDDGDGFADTLKSWRHAWNVPQHVYLAAGDNRLLLDLDERAHADLLRAELTRGDPRGLAGWVLLQEALPGADGAWLAGPGGRYMSELVVPMILRPRVAVRDMTTRVESTDAGATAEPTYPDPTSEGARRLRPPGSDWLFVKLYGPSTGADAVLTGPIRRLVGELIDARDADSWFFLRYADPEPHLRLRLHGDPNRLFAGALPRLAMWAAGLVATGARSRFTIETYERELERYGGAAAMAVAEAIFGADSAAVAALLGQLPPTAADAGRRLELAVLSTDRLLAALGLDAAERLAWCAAAAPPPQLSGAAFRERKLTLRTLLSATPGPPPPDLGGAAEAVLCTMTDTVAPLAARLTAMHASGAASVPVTDLAHSLVHLHANRWGLDRDTERLVLGLLRRTLASLAAAPPRD